MKPGIDFPLYEGSLDRKKLSQEARNGLESYYSQRGKCINPKNRWFKHYGGKGFTAEYTSREFVSWWLHNLKTFKGKTATVGRIDHNKGYYFDNITMQCVTENSREAFIRNKLHIISKCEHGKKVYVYSKNKTHIATFDSIRDAAVTFDVSQRLVQKVIRKEILNSKKLKFIITGELM